MVESWYELTFNMSSCTLLMEIALYKSQFYYYKQLLKNQARSNLLTIYNCQNKSIQ